MRGLRRLEELALPPIVRGLRRLPFSLAEGIMIGLSLGQALLDPGRLRRAHAWAAASRAGSRGACGVVLGALVHRGRALATCPALGILDPERFRARLDVEGLRWLEDARARGGVVLLGFHLGLLALDQGLALLGHDLAVLGGPGRFRWPPTPESWRPARQRIQGLEWAEDAPGSQAYSLYRLRRHAAAGGTVMIMGDGASGRALFDLPLPGASLVVRAGWFALRRLTGLPSLPVLCHRERGRWRLTIHPPLPAPQADESRDREACRAALATILGSFVARYPEQCLFLAAHAGDAPAPRVPAPLPGSPAGPPSGGGRTVCRP